VTAGAAGAYRMGELRQSLQEARRTALSATGMRFLVSGAANTALGFAIFRVLLFLYGDTTRAIAAAQATAYAIGIAVSYFLNRRWTFRADGTHRREFPRFLAAHLGALVLSSILLQLGVSLLGLPLMVCFILVTGVTTVVNFVVQRFWVFTPR
jgi:putative flippase GtrA